MTQVFRARARTKGRGLCARRGELASVLHNEFRARRKAEYPLAGVRMDERRNLSNNMALAGARRSLDNEGRGVPEHVRDRGIDKALLVGAQGHFNIQYLVGLPR